MSGTSVTLDAANGITGTRLSTSADVLAARSASGNVFIGEATAVTLNTISGIDNVARGSGIYDVVAGGTITVAGPVNAGGAGLTALQSNSGDIRLNAATTVGNSSGATFLNALSGSIGGPGVIVGNGLHLHAQSGIGSAATALQTQTGALEAQMTSGGVFINNTGGLQIGGVSGGLSGLAANSLNLTTTGAITQTEAVTVSGATVLNAGSANDITLTNASNNFARLSIAAANDVSLTNANGLTLAASTISGNLSVTAAGAMTLAGLVSLDGSGTASLRANASGSVLDGTAGEQTDLTAGSLAIRASGIGAADDLDTAVSVLALSNAGGDVNISDAGALTIGTVDGLVGISNTASGRNTNITASSPLTISADAITAGDATYTAGESATADVDHLTIGPNVTVRSTGGNLTLRAGDNFSMDASSTVQAAGSVTILADFGDLDADGETLDLLGVITGSSVSLSAATTTTLLTSAAAPPAPTSRSTAATGTTRSITTPAAKWFRSTATSSRSTAAPSPTMASKRSTSSTAATKRRRRGRTPGSR